MNQCRKEYCQNRVILRGTTFAPDSCISEAMSIFTLRLADFLPFTEQLDLLLSAWNQWRSETPNQRPVFIRFFLSDIANQEALIDASQFADCAYSILQQPPADSYAKIALWCYSINHIETARNGQLFLAQHGDYTHYWCGNRQLAQGDSFSQTQELLEQYEAELIHNDMRFENDCIRTWFFVQNVDANYQGMVEGRKCNFDATGLTADTHYIASTGIEGRGSNVNAQVMMDAYAVKGLQQGQIQYLYAKEHLNPTYEYGVTFERGTKVKYGDRSHIFISGTASIDNQGNVLHIGDITQQTRRMIENVEALLAEASASFQDTMMAIIYLRDPADRSEVEKIFSNEERGNIPRVYVHAPVCRPTWLVEMECIAMTHECHPSFPNF